MHQLDMAAGCTSHLDEWKLVDCLVILRWTGWPASLCVWWLLFPQKSFLPVQLYFGTFYLLMCLLNSDGPIM